MELLFIAIAALVVLAIVAAIVIIILKKRQSAYDDDYDAPEDNGDIQTLEAPTPTQVPAVDPLVRVDAFINEQRYDNAIAELKRFLMSNPKSTDAMLKLLQVYGITNNHKAFNQLHAKIHEIADSNTIEQADFCRSLLEDDLDPKASSPVVAKKEIAIDTLEFDAGKPAPVAQPVAQQEPTLEPIDEFMLDDFDLSPSTPAPTTQNPSQEDDSFGFDDFDLGIDKPNINSDTDSDSDFDASFAMDFDTPVSEPQPKPETQTDDDFDLSNDFDLSFDTSTANTPSPTPTNEPLIEEELGFGELSFDSAPTNTTNNDLPSFDLSDSVLDEKDDTSFDFDPSPATTPAPSLDTDFNFDNDFGSTTDKPEVEFDAFASANQLDELSFNGGFDVKEDVKGENTTDNLGFNFDEPKFDEPAFNTPSFDTPNFDEPKFDTPSFDEPKFDEPKAEPSIDFGDFAFDKPKTNQGTDTTSNFDADFGGDFSFDTPAQNNQSSDGLSLDEFGFDTPTPAPTPAPSIDFGGSKDSGLDFADLGSELDNNLNNTPSTQNSGLDLADFGFDDTPAPAPAPMPEPVPVPVASVVAPVMATVAPAKPTVSTQSLNVPNRDFTNAPDNLAVTLELAQAYLGLGEHESARHLLEEVLAKGSPDEQQSANALLARIA